MDKVRTILVADDAESMRKTIIRALKTQGFQNFLEAADGFEALAVLKSAEAPVSLIISDWNMPFCTGMDFLKLVRGDKLFASIPFLMVTSEAERGLILEAISLGVNGYIIKPFTSESLCARVLSVLDKVS